MIIVGYGEDALTFWALTHRMPEILVSLGDPSNVAEVVLYYRPSFGRRGSIRVAPGEVADSAQFGEFDAVLGTPRGVYLFEAKWSRSSEIDGPSLSLRPEQIRRHEILRAYLTAWRSQNPAGWTQFLSMQGGLLDVGLFRIPVAPSESQLAGNLERILRRLSCCGQYIGDVLLYLRLTGGPTVATVKPEGFHLVTIDCPSEAGFIELGAANGALPL